MKFSDLDKTTQISVIKSEVSSMINCILEEDEDVIKSFNLPQDFILEVKEKMKSFLKKDCICGMCIDLTTLKLFPQEMVPLIDAAKEKVAKGNY